MYLGPPKFAFFFLDDTIFEKVLTVQFQKGRYILRGKNNKRSVRHFLLYVGDEVRKSPRVSAHITNNVRVTNIICIHTGTGNPRTGSFYS